MTPGERFDQDEVLRFGQPWHGLWRNNVIELPNSLTRERFGPPDGSFGSFAVRIPGQPAVTTPAEDAAQGMTWLNYGIFNGLERPVFQGGATFLWVFIDADNIPWRAGLTFSTGLMTVTLKRFGIIGGDPDNVSYAASVAFALPVSIGGPAGDTFWICDIDSTGRQVACGVADANTAGGIRIFLLTLSGPAATFTLGLSDETPDPPLDYTSATFADHDPRSVWIEDNGVLAGVYSGDWTGNIDFEFLEGHSYKVSFGPMLRPHSWSRYVYVIGATLIDDTFALVRWTVYTEYLSVATIDMNHLFDHYLPNTGEPRLAPVSYVASTESATYTMTLNGIDTEVSGEWHRDWWQWPPFTPEDVAGQGYAWSIYLDNVSHIPVPGVIADHAEQEGHYTGYASRLSDGYFKAVRLTNRIYCAGLDRYQGSWAFRPFMVCGPNDSVISSGWETDADIRYATAHPLTGQMVTGSAPVCWV